MEEKKSYGKVEGGDGKGRKIGEKQEIKGREGEGNVRVCVRCSGRVMSVGREGPRARKI